MDISVILPCYNESARVADTVKSVNAYLGAKGHRFEIIAVDDGSGDGTNDILKNLAREIAALRVIRYSENRGKGYAVRQGVNSARFETVMFMDVDLATPVETIAQFAVHEPHADVAIGSRALPDSVIVRSQTAAKVKLGRAGNALIQFLLLPGIRDTQCGYKVFFHNSAQKIFRFTTVDRWGFDFEVLFIARRLGLRILELPVTWTDSGKSSVSPLSYVKTIGELMRVRVNDWQGKYRNRETKMTNY